MPTKKQINPEEFKILAITLFISICGGFGIDIHLASLPQIMLDLATDKSHMQQSVAIYLFGIGASMLFYGPLSDRYGRRPIMIFGLSVGLIASFACILAENVNSFLTYRLIQGLGLGVCSGIGRTIFADTLVGVRFILVGSYLSMITSLSPLVAPALGGYLQHWFGWHANFVCLGTMVSLALFFFTMYCPETNHHRNQDAFSLRGTYLNYKTLMMHPVFDVSALLCGIGMATTMVYAAVSPFILQTQFHLSPVVYGWITAIIGLGNFVGKFINSIFIRQIGSIRTMNIGLILMLLSGIWLLFFHALGITTLGILIIAVFNVTLCQTFISMSATSFALSPFHDKRGTASALFSSFQILIAFISSGIAGAFTANGVMVLALTYCILGLIGLVSYLRLLKPRIA
jgi:Bcr/CflA subfamily drug resistance transporter